MSSPLIWNGSNAKALTNDILLSNSSFNTLRVGNAVSTNASTGIISGGVLAINGGDNTKFDLSAGTGIIITYTSPLVPTYQMVSWSAFTAQTVTNLATANGTYILINSAGAIIQQIAFPTAAQRRANIFIGLLGHSTRTVILSANTIPDMVQSSASQEYDFFDALGPFNIAGNTVAPNGANLNINTSGGTMFQRSFNYSTTPQNPHVVTVAGATPATFSYILQTGNALTPTTTVDVAFYDNGGVRTGIPAGNASIQRVFLGANGRVFIAYGQNTYASVAAATAAVGTDSFIQNPSITAVTILIGYMIMLRNATNLSTQATFLNAPRFYAGVGGGSNTVLSMQDTYNASVQPQITLSSAMGGIQYLDNATPLGTTLFQVASSGAATNFLSVSSAATTVNQLIDSGLTASRAVVSNASKQLTSSATTDTQIGYLSNTVSDVQAQIDTKQGTNLILFPGFENNSVSFWSLGTTGTLTNGIPTGSPTFGSGASGNLSISAVSSGALLGTYSMQYQHVTNQTVAGNMVATNAITIQPEFQGKVMGVKFAYSTTVNPTNGNYSGTSANSFGWALYDVTNSAWIGTAGQFNIVQNSGVGICTGTVQLPINTTSVRFVFYNVTATSATTGGGAITLLLDDFYLGPQVTANAPAMSDWTSFPTTISNTTNCVANSSTYRRVGDSIELSYNLQWNGTGTNTNAPIVTIPSGMVIDTSKINTNHPYIVVGEGQYTNAGSTNYPALVAINIGSTTSLQLLVLGSGTTNDLGGVLPVTPKNTDGCNFLAKLPIVGFSSNTVSSADTDTRVIAMQTSGTPTATFSSGAFNPVIWPSIALDNTASYSVSTGLFTCPVAGIYEISAAVELAATWASGNEMFFRVYKNGTSGTLVGAGTVLAQSTQARVEGPLVTCQAQFNAGDTIGLYVRNVGSIGSPSFTANASGSTMGIKRLSGPAVVQATETVAARYSGSSSSISASFTPITFTTKTYDTHNAYSGSTFTAPVSGKYSVKAMVQSGSATVSTTQSTNIAIYKNGVQQSMTFLIGNGASVQYTPSISDTVNCVAGDTIQIYSSGGVASTAQAGYVAIERVGN